MPWKSPPTFVPSGYVPSLGCQLAVNFLFSQQRIVLCPSLGTEFSDIGKVYLAQRAISSHRSSSFTFLADPTANPLLGKQTWGYSPLSARVRYRIPIMNLILQLCAIIHSYPHSWLQIGYSGYIQNTADCHGRICCQQCAPNIIC